MGEGEGREIRRVCGCGWRLRWRGEAERGWGGCVRVVFAVQVCKQARRQARCFRRVAFRWRHAGERVARARGFRQLYARPGRARAAA